MKKKLIITAIITLLFSLTSCSLFSLFEPQEADPVYMDSWLNMAESPEKDPNAPEFKIKGNENGFIYDFDLVIRDALASKTKGAVAKKMDKADIDDPDVMYLTRNSLGRFDCFTIKLYEDGTINTTASGGGWSAPKSQYYQYTISAESASYIIETARNRYREIIEDTKKERQAIEGEEGLANFFKQIEESEEPATIDYRETRMNYDSYTFTVQDEGERVLGKLEELTFTPLENYSTNLLPMINYYVDEDWKIQIYCGLDNIYYDIASIQYKYNGEYKTYYPSYFMKYYAIDSQKGEEIADIIRSMASAQ